MTARRAMDAPSVRFESFRGATSVRRRRRRRSTLPTALDAGTNGVGLGHWDGRMGGKVIV